MLNSNTFSCGRYGYSFWPIWSFRVADVVVADMVQTCGWLLPLISIVIGSHLTYSSGFPLKCKDKKPGPFQNSTYQKIRTYFSIILGLEQQI